MPIKQIQLRPGIVRDVTSFTNQGGWYDCDKVRFRMGMPESIGGWRELPNNSAIQFGSSSFGVCRTLHQWTTLLGVQYTAIGTNKKLFVYNNVSAFDITPIRLTTTLANNPFTTINVPNSNQLIVNHTGHGASLGDFVTFSGSSDVGSYLASFINREQVVTEVINSNQYKITLGMSVNNPPVISGGGAAVVAEYQISIGPEDASPINGGWGMSPWGFGTWGGVSTGTSQAPRIWSIDNFGEDLVAAIIGGKIYYWDSSAGTVRAVELSSLPGSNQCPIINSAGIAVSEGDRHLLVFGANPRGSTAADPLLIRYCDQENVLEWEARRDTTAGGQRISAGSRILSHSRGRQETVVWTDIGMNTLTFVGPPYTFGLNTIASNVSIVGPNAATEARNQIYWMDLNAFRFYNGSVNTLPCTVQSYVFDDFNWLQREKVCAGHNSRFNEIWWWYPSATSTENNRYVAYNYVDNYWVIGNMSRTAWLDSSFTGYPISFGKDSGSFALYEHEFGTNAANAALSSYIEGSDLTILDGESFAFISRIAPDFTRVGSDTFGTLTFQIKERNFPQNSSTIGFSGALVSTAEPKELFVRVRARQFSLRVSAEQLNMGWRLGTTRFDIREDGRKN